MSQLTKTDLIPPISSPTVTITADKIYTTYDPPTSATGGYATYDPYAHTASTTSIYSDDLSNLTYTYPITTSTTYPITVTTGASQDDLDEATEKIDKHIDKLEEDIDYFEEKIEEFDQKLEHQLDQIVYAKNAINQLVDQVKELNAQKEDLQQKLEAERTARLDLTHRLNWMDTLFNNLLVKLDIKVEDLIC